MTIWEDQDTLNHSAGSERSAANPGCRNPLQYMESRYQYWMLGSTSKCNTCKVDTNRTLFSFLLDNLTTELSEGRC